MPFSPITRRLIWGYVLVHWKEVSDLGGKMVRVQDALQEIRTLTDTIPTLGETIQSLDEKIENVKERIPRRLMGEEFEQIEEMRTEADRLKEKGEDANSKRFTARQSAVH